MNRIGITLLALALGSAPLLQAGTSLSKAAIAGNATKIQACLAAGEKIDDIDKWGWTALMWAVYYRSVPATQCLLENKADPNIQSSRVYSSIPKQSTSLIICAYYGLDELTRMLMKAGANPALTNEKGKKALDYAQEYSFEEVIQALNNKSKSPAPAVQATPEPTPEPTPRPTPRPTPTPRPQPTPEPAGKPVPQRPIVQPTPAPTPTPEPTPAPTPTPTAKPLPAKKPVRVKKQEGPKSEPPAIK